jgi:hypothetical protein
MNMICPAHCKRGANKAGDSYKLQLYYEYTDTADMKVQPGTVVTNRTFDNEGSERKWLKSKIMCYEKQKTEV